MARYLYEDPWPGVVVLGCTAFALLLAALRRRGGAQRGLAVAAAAAAVGAVAVYALATAVTTDREHVEQETRRLVDATAPVDLPTLRTLISESAAVVFPNGAALPMSLALSDELAHAVGRHAVRGQSVSGLHAESVADDAIDVRLNVRSTLAEYDYHPFDTEWLLTWRRDPAGHWRVVAVRWLKFENREPTPDLWR